MENRLPALKGHDSGPHADRDVYSSPRRLEFGLIFTDDTMALLTPIIAGDGHFAAEANHGGI